jgi:hypothetical protein
MDFGFDSDIAQPFNPTFAHTTKMPKAMKPFTMVLIDKKWVKVLNYSYGNESDIAATKEHFMQKDRPWQPIRLPMAYNVSTTEFPLNPHWTQESDYKKK